MSCGTKQEYGVRTVKNAIMTVVIRSTVAVRIFVSLFVIRILYES